MSIPRFIIGCALVENDSRRHGRCGLWPMTWGGFPGFSLFGDQFAASSRGSASKVFMHRLLERAPTPTLWTVNDARHISPAILRRMIFAFELRPPTSRIRMRVWARQLERRGIEATPEEVRVLVVKFDATLGQPRLRPPAILR